MSLEKKFIKDEKRQVIGSVTTGYGAEQSIVRDSDGSVTGRTSGQFNVARDGKGNLKSVNSSDPGLLIKRKK
jgi:hypothetical protein